MDASITTYLGAHQSIGYRALINEGSDEQKESGYLNLPVERALPLN